MLRTCIKGQSANQNHYQPICLLTVQKPAINLFDPHMHVQPLNKCSALYLEEAAVYNIYNLVLLLHRHLVIRWQAQSTSENIGPYVHRTP